MQGSITALKKALTSGTKKNSPVQKHISLLNTDVQKLADIRKYYVEARQQGELEHINKRVSPAVSELRKGITLWGEVFQHFGLVAKDKATPMVDLIVDEKLRTTVWRLFESAQNNDTQEMIRQWKGFWFDLRDSGVMDTQEFLKIVDSIKGIAEEPDWSYLKREWYRLRDMRMTSDKAYDVYSEGWPAFVKRTGSPLRAGEELRREFSKMEGKGVDSEEEAAPDKQPWRDIRREWLKLKGIISVSGRLAYEHRDHLRGSGRLAWEYRDLFRGWGSFVSETKTTEKAAMVLRRVGEQMEREMQSDRTSDESSTSEPTNDTLPVGVPSLPVHRVPQISGAEIAEGLHVWPGVRRQWRKLYNMQLASGIPKEKLETMREFVKRTGTLQNAANEVRLMKQRFEDGERIVDSVDPVLKDPEVSEPEVSKLEVSGPEVSDAEVRNPEVIEPEVSEPEVSNLEVIGPATSDLEMSGSEVSNPEVSEPEVSNPEVSNLEVIGPATSDPEMSDSEVSNPEVSDPETNNPEVSNLGVIGPATSDLEEVSDLETSDPETSNPETSEPDMSNAKVSSLEVSDPEEVIGPETNDWKTQVITQISRTNDPSVNENSPVKEVEEHQAMRRTDED